MIFRNDTTGYPDACACTKEVHCSCEVWAREGGEVTVFDNFFDVQYEIEWIRRNIFNNKMARLSVCVCVELSKHAKNELI